MRKSTFRVSRMNRNNTKVINSIEFKSESIDKAKNIALRYMNKAGYMPEGKINYNYGTMGWVDRNGKFERTVVYGDSRSNSYGAMQSVELQLEGIEGDNQSPSTKETIIMKANKDPKMFRKVYVERRGMGANFHTNMYQEYNRQCYVLDSVEWKARTEDDLKSAICSLYKMHKNDPLNHAYILLHIQALRNLRNQYGPGNTVECAMQEEAIETELTGNTNPKGDNPSPSTKETVSMNQNLLSAIFPVGSYITLKGENVDQEVFKVIGYKHAATFGGVFEDCLQVETTDGYERNLNPEYFRIITESETIASTEPPITIIGTNAYIEMDFDSAKSIIKNEAKALIGSPVFLDGYKGVKTESNVKSILIFDILDQATAKAKVEAKAEVEAKITAEVEAKIKAEVEAETIESATPEQIEEWAKHVQEEKGNPENIKHRDGGIIGTIKSCSDALLKIKRDNSKLAWIKAYEQAGLLRQDGYKIRRSDYFQSQLTDNEQNWILKVAKSAK